MSGPDTVSTMRVNLKLRFRGRDGSMGFVRGRLYEVTVLVGLGDGGPYMVVPVTCPYASWQSFWRNWETA